MKLKQGIFLPIMKNKIKLELELLMEKLIRAPKVLS